MKMCERLEVDIHSFLTSTLGGGVFLAHVIVRLRKIYHCPPDLVGPRAILDHLERIKLSAGIRTTIDWSSSP